jgi:hypothetical protein
MFTENEKQIVELAKELEAVRERIREAKSAARAKVTAERKAKKLAAANAKKLARQVRAIDRKNLHVANVLIHAIKVTIRHHGVGTSREVVAKCYAIARRELANRSKKAKRNSK